MLICNAYNLNNTLIINHHTCLHITDMFRQTLHEVREVIFVEKMIVQFVFLSFEFLWPRLCATQYLEHVLIKQILILLAIFPMNDGAELWEVNEPIPDIVVGEVNHLLLHGVESQHLHGVHQVLGQDGGLSETSLEAPEDPGDDLLLKYY